MVQSERITVEQWRVKQFLRFGYGRLAAEKLARDGVDVRDLEKLLEAGCSLELAAQIV